MMDPITVLVTALVVALTVAIIVYLIDQVSMEPRAKNILKAVIVIVGVLVFLRYIDLF